MVEMKFGYDGILSEVAFAGNVLLLVIVIVRQKMGAPFLFQLGKKASPSFDLEMIVLFPYFEKSNLTDSFD